MRSPSAGHSKGDAPLSPEVVIRQLEEADVEPVARAAWAPLREATIRYHHEEMPDLQTDEAAARSRDRIDHIRRHDPEGSWVAELAGEIVGVGLATVREGIWFLSLLTVSGEVQSKGVGRKLLDATLAYAEGCKGSWIMSSLDPRALHRYGAAGFSLHPGYEAKAKVNRSLLTAQPAVREGSYDTDAGWIDDLIRTLRGAAYGPDIEATKARGARLLVIAEGEQRAYSFFGNKNVWNLGATSAELAQRILIASVAEGMGDDGEFSIGALTATQQWAIDVALDLKMSLVPGVSLCLQGELGPMTPYLPNGAYG